MNIAFLGLGIMGSRMAANLIKAGNTLTVWNRSLEKAGPLEELGAKKAGTPADAVQGAEVVITMLATPEAVEATAFGPQGFLDHIKKGALWIDSSTVNPSFSKRMASEAQSRGIRFLDAPVAGTRGPAEQGQLLFLVGGNAGDLETARPLLEKMGRAIIHAGDAGMGTSLKMIFNLLLGVNMIAFSEALVLGEALGITRDKLFEVLTGSAVVAPAATGKRARIEAGNYEADFPLRWAQKDLQLAAQSAYEQGVSLPTVNAAKEIFMLAVQYGYGEDDLSAIYPFLKHTNQRGEDE